MSQDPHQQSVTQLSQVAKLLQSSYADKKDRFANAIELLKSPDKVLETELSITLDDGSEKSFTAYRSQHNNARGPYKGGIQFHPQVSLEEVKALSTWMTWKCAVTGIPYGGGKGGIIVDPKTLSQAELQRLSRAYAAWLAPFIGPWVDVPAPDVNTNPQIMAWMVDEYQNTMLASANLSENPVATFTGKPLELGGSQGREEATGLGGFYVLESLFEEIKKEHGWKVKSDVTIAVQGFGNVGYWFIQHAVAAGYTVVAVSDSKGGVYVESGLDAAKVLETKQQTGSVSNYTGKQISNEELLTLDVDIIVPAALEGVITAENVGDISAKVVLELANGPTTPEADAALHNNGVLVVPDVLANAGGVSTSYFEWVQNLHGYYWTHQEVLAKLEPLMKDAFTEFWQTRGEHKVDGRMAAYLVAVKRVVDAMLIRGRV